MLSNEKYSELKNNFSGTKVAVIGDLMLDCYFWGNVQRISPEAPVPVIEIDKEIFRFGGAANVAYNLVTLGAEAFPIGVVGADEDGERLKYLMTEKGINQDGLIIDDQRPTTAKTRIIAKTQHVVRLDKESKNNIRLEIEDRIVEHFKELCPKIDAVILQDYNKGVLTKSLIQKIINISNENKIIISIDPKFHNFFEYKNVTVFKPNKKETEDALGVRITDKSDIVDIGKKLYNELKCKHILLTLGADGLVLFSEGEEMFKIPTKARKVADVSGAGDTVISTLTVALSAGANIKDAAYLANFAGGLVCEEVGIVPINKEKLFESVIKEI